MQNSEAIRKELLDLIINFENELQSDDLRNKVLSLIPCFHNLRDLGRSLIPIDSTTNARDRILYYFKKYPFTIIGGDELLVVSAIQEYARRVRELRVQFGWSIVNGITAKQMMDEDGFHLDDANYSNMRPSDYILLSEQQDREAAHRWNIANDIRREHIAVRDKLIKFFRTNVGKKITGEELRYVARDRTEWARRVRELRTEFGWPIVTKNTGRPDLEVGVYLLEADRQSPEHDRKIPDQIKGEVLRRDGYKCRNCGWSHKEWNRSDPRHLELHHIEHHADGGENIAKNLRTLCIICHDGIHSR
jgi:hypothetical protein